MRPSRTALAAMLLATASAKAETTVERGRSLATTIGGCGNCHTPRHGGTLEGKVVPGTQLSGGAELDEDIGHLSMPKITPDTDTGIGEWTNAQIVTALRDGKRPDGKILGPPMPIPVYRNLSDNDASAIATYLLSLKTGQPPHSAKPIQNPVAGKLRTSSDPCRRPLADRQSGPWRLSGDLWPLCGLPYSCE